MDRIPSTLMPSQPRSSAAPSVSEQIDRLSVIIPAYNEILSLGEMIRRVHEVSVTKEILIVDDGSTDGTREFLQRLEKDPEWLLPPGAHPSSLKVFFHLKNLGKGAAIRTAVPHATGQITVIQDADLEYNP